MPEQKQKTIPRSRWQALKRHFHAVRLENSGGAVMSFVEPFLLMTIVVALVWNIGEGFRPKLPVIEIDYAQLFFGDAVKLDDGRVRLFYDFSPRPDGFVEYPQLQDWAYKQGIRDDALLGQASLRAAFTRQVEVSFDFQLLSGYNIVPSVGVRDNGRTRIAVMIENTGRVSVWRFVEKTPARMAQVDTGRTFLPREKHTVLIKAFTTYPDNASPEMITAMTEPEPVQMPDDVMNHPPVPLPEEKTSGPAPFTDVQVFMDGAELVKCRVRRYVLDGWIMLDLWNSSALFDNVSITGNLYPEWVALELFVRRKMSAIGRK